MLFIHQIGFKLKSQILVFLLFYALCFYFTLTVYYFEFNFFILLKKVVIKHINDFITVNAYEGILRFYAVSFGNRERLNALYYYRNNIPLRFR